MVLSSTDLYTLFIVFLLGSFGVLPDLMIKESVVVRDYLYIGTTPL